MSEATMTRAGLVEALREAGDEAVARLRRLSPENLEGGGYENGWNRRQILAHVASIEWTYPRLIDLARAGGQQVEAGERATSAPPKGGMGGYNERQVEKR